MKHKCEYFHKITIDFTNYSREVLVADRYYLRDGALFAYLPDDIIQCFPMNNVKSYTIESSCCSRISNVDNMP